MIDVDENDSDCHRHGLFASKGPPQTEMCYFHYLKLLGLDECANVCLTFDNLYQLNFVEIFK